MRAAVDRHVFVWCLTAALGVHATIARAQSPTVSAKPVQLTLGKPELVTAAEFNYALSAVRFANGNILVADPADRDLKLVNGRTGAVRLIGRTGAGPGEYQHPSWVIPWSGNTAVVFDTQLMRAVQVDANGAVLRTSPMPQIIPGPEMSVSADRAGRVFLTQTPFDIDRPAPSSTQTVMRWSWGERRATPVMTIQGSQQQVFKGTSTEGPGGERMMVTSQNVPYSIVDAFAVLSDGSQVIARGATRVLEWRDSTGRVNATTAFPGSPVAISDSAKALVKPAVLRAAVGRWYPPFASASVVVSANDRVWLKALPERGDSVDWIGFRRGEAAPQLIRLKRSSIILGVSEPYLMVLHFGDGGDDLRHLEVYRLPK